MTKTENVLLWTSAFLILCIPTTANFATEMLEEHNDIRKSHGCPPLELDAGLSKEAKEWAQSMADKGALTHSEANGEYGENLFMGFFVAGGKTPVISWYSEMKDYNWDKPGFSPATGHFTALIWKSSKRLGVGHVKSGSFQYVVARYKPAGNIAGQFEENVPRIRLSSGACQKTLASNMILIFMVISSIGAFTIPFKFVIL